MLAAGGVLSFHTVVLAARLCSLVGGENFLVAVAQYLVVVGVRQLVQHEVRHAPDFRGEDADVGELYALHHRRIASVVAEPPGAGVILGARPHARVFGREPELHPAQLLDRGSGHHADDLLQLRRQQLQRAVCGGGVSG